MILSPERSQLLVIDIQERLLPAMPAPERLVERELILIKSARHMSVPIIVTEQYPKGLGPTVPTVAEAAAAAPVVEKVTFSLPDSAEAMAAIEGNGRDQIILTGLEAHICILQTAIALQQRGFSVHIVADAVASRDPENKALALERARQVGVTIVTSEMVLFEWLGRAATEPFRTLSRLVR